MIFSEFMLYFFYQILYTSIIATVIGIIILLIKKATDRRLSPRANYIIWLVFLLTLTFPISIPSRISIYNYIDISDVKYVSNEKSNNMIRTWRETDDETKIKVKAPTNVTKNNNHISKNYISIILAFSWFIIFVVKLTKSMFSYIALSRLAGNDEVTDERIVLILEKCKKRLKIRKNIKVIQQDVMKAPATIGVFNVKILMTNDLLRLNDMAILNIIMHELSHYKRKDNVVNFAILIFKALHWFNPLMKIAFRNIRDEMELATDEMAIGKMDLEEERSYCKIMVMIAGMNNLRNEQLLLGLSSNKKKIEKRIDMMSLKDKFKERSKIIVTITFIIVLLMCLVFYPTSYGMFKVPKLYLKLENGDKVELSRIEEDNSNMNEVKLKSDSEIELVVKDGKPKGNIVYQEIDLDTMELNERIANVFSNKITYWKSGNYIYKFTLTYGNGKSMDYAIKIIVE